MANIARWRPNSHRMHRSTYDRPHRPPDISDYRTKMYRIPSNDRPNVRALQQLCAVDSSAFGFRSFDRCLRPQRTHEHPSVDRRPKIAQISDKRVHVLAWAPERNDVLAPHSGVAKLAERTQMSSPNWKIISSFTANAKGTQKTSTNSPSFRSSNAIFAGQNFWNTILLNRRWLLQTQFCRLFANPLRNAKRFKCLEIFRHFAEKIATLDEVNALFRCAGEKKQQHVLPSCQLTDGILSKSNRWIHACDETSDRNKNNVASTANNTLLPSFALTSQRSQHTIRKWPDFTFFSLTHCWRWCMDEYRCREWFPLFCF